MQKQRKIEHSHKKRQQKKKDVSMRK